MRRVVTGHVAGHVILPHGLDSRAATAASAYLPGGWSSGPPDARAVAPVVEVSLGETRVTVDSAMVRVRLNEATAESDTLAYVTYTALERARQQQGKVTLHATSMVEPSGRAVLLLGTKGAGKTSTALALAERGWQHAGDDLVVLGESDDGSLSVWPGKRIAAIRDPAQPLAPKAQLTLAPFVLTPSPLAWIVRLAVHPAVPTASLRPAVPISVNERLRLQENLGRYISGLPTPISGVDQAPYGPVWPLDHPALARWRSHLIARLEHHRFDYLCAPNPVAAGDILAREAQVG